MFFSEIISGPASCVSGSFCQDLLVHLLFNSDPVFIIMPSRPLLCLMTRVEYRTVYRTYKTHTCYDKPGVSNCGYRLCVTFWSNRWLQNWRFCRFNARGAPDEMKSWPGNRVFWIQWQQQKLNRIILIGPTMRNICTLNVWQLHDFILVPSVP